MSEPWSSGKLRKCQKCPFETYRGDRMTEHKAAKHGKGGMKTFMCDECAYDCRQKQQLVNHVNIVHRNKKPFKCDECDYETGYPNNLAQHKQIHKPDKKLMCEQGGEWSNFVQLSGKSPPGIVRQRE